MMCCCPSADTHSTACSFNYRLAYYLFWKRWQLLHITSHHSQQTEQDAQQQIQQQARQEMKLGKQHEHDQDKEKHRKDKDKHKGTEREKDRDRHQGKQPAAAGAGGAVGAVGTAAAREGAKQEEVEEGREVMKAQLIHVHLPAWLTGLAFALHPAHTEVSCTALYCTVTAPDAIMLH